MKEITIENINTWPSQIIDFFESNNGKLSENKVYKSFEALRKNILDCGLRGYHFSRLTKTEIQSVQTKGMILPNSDFLRDRITILEKERIISAREAEYLKANNEGDGLYRPDKIYFVFCSAPTLVDGVESLVRYWGGEALYCRHENDSIHGPLLAGIGIPCIIEAFVPLAGINYYASGLYSNFMNSFIMNYAGLPQLKKGEAYKEGISILPISSGNIIRVIQRPEADFTFMTGCDTWDTLN